MGTANLLLISQRFNKTVKVQKKIDKEMQDVFSDLPYEPLEDWRDPSLNTTKWTPVRSAMFYNNVHDYDNETNILLLEYNAELVIRNFETVQNHFRPHIRADVIKVIQRYFHSLEAKSGHKLTFINIHVRRTDYINFLAKRFQGKTVDGKFFNYCIEEFLGEYPSAIFLVTSDDIEWCREHLKHDKVVFPELKSEHNPMVTDFVLMTQVNHSIYDYGSFAFFGALLAGGKTMVADGYSGTTHKLLGAVKIWPPPGWKTVDIRNLS